MPAGDSASPEGELRAAFVRLLPAAPGVNDERDASITYAAARRVPGSGSIVPCRSKFW
jgi:hypothetical protein